jgi:hypothetical protein
MEPVVDGISESYRNLIENLDNAIIRFSMKDEKNGIQKIFMNPAHIVQKLKNNPDVPTDYYIYYKWKENDTKIKGRFIGEFSIVLLNGELISPIRENLYINII